MLQGVVRQSAAQPRVVTQPQHLPAYLLWLLRIKEEAVDAILEPYPARRLFLRR